MRANKRRWQSFATCVALALLGAITEGCRSEEPQVGSQTNWLLDCDTSEDCGGLECICGTCTQACSSQASCGSLGSSSCAAADSSGVVALCGGESSSTDFCVLECDGDSDACPAGSSCLAGVCSPNRMPTASVTIDPEQRFQALVGFGAGLATDEETILAHPEADALLDAMFGESGFEMLRLKNRFEGDNPEDLVPAQRIIAEATARLNKSPRLFLSSDSPPANLKANGSRTCANYDQGCTLSRNSDGGFDYAAFADYWSASLTAYSEAGINPDYVSIQSNTDWLPPKVEAEACRLLPQEGISNVTLESGESVEVEFAGYVEALAAVKSVIEPEMLAKIAAPEVGSSPMVFPYTDVLDASEYSALAFHLYGEEALGGNRDFLVGIRQLAEKSEHPAIQSEMEETGLNTAVLAHHALVTAGGAAYLQRRFLGEDMSDEGLSLIGTDGETFRLLPPYHALAHFARSTQPGWNRVEAQFDESALLASAWIAPDDSALTIVVINPTTSPQVAELQVPAGWEEALTESSVTRTVFDGLERSTPLGTVAPTHVVSLPGNSILTVAISAP